MKQYCILIKILFIIHHQLRKYIIEGTWIQTIFYQGLIQAFLFLFVFCFVDFLENIQSINYKLNFWFPLEFIFSYYNSKKFLFFVYVIWISWNQINCNEMYIKWCFMAWFEINISQCILAFRIPVLHLELIGWLIWDLEPDIHGCFAENPIWKNHNIPWNTEVKSFFIEFTAC